jgi:hypothetical protein
MFGAGPNLEKVEPTRARVSPTFEAAYPSGVNVQEKGEALPLWHPVLADRCKSLGLPPVY